MSVELPRRQAPTVLGERVRTGLLVTAALLAMVAAVTTRAAVPVGKPSAFRVCADPNNLPFSNRSEEGFENKIAHVLADDLGLPVEYAWYPMQMGFARKTLIAYQPEKNRYRCDVIIGTTSGLDVGKTTKPYYYSTYTLVYRRGNGMDGVESLDDILSLPKERRETLKIGIFAGSPITSWLIRHHLMQQVHSYQRQSGSQDVTPGSIIRSDLGSGKLDMIVVWGPIGGYYAKKLRKCGGCRYTDMAVVKLESQPGEHYVFGISMGVRYGDAQWLHTIESLIQRNADRINAILRDYNVPLVDARGRPVASASE